MQGRPRIGSGEIWSQHIESPEQWKVRLKSTFQQSVLSEGELATLGEEWAAHGRKNKWKLVDLTHAFPEWDERARSLKTSIPIPLVDILQAMGLPNKTIESRLSAIRAADYFDDLLDQAAAGLLDQRR